METNVLLLSQRKISNLVAFCIGYEFEDTFADVTQAHRVDVSSFSSLEFSRRIYKLMRQTSRSSQLAQLLAPRPRGAVVLERDYDLFFPIFSHAYEIYSLAFVPNWRERSRRAACFITETGLDQLPNYQIELLSAFDHLFLGSEYGVEELGRMTGRPCTYLPIAVDVLRFAAAEIEERPIEICNIGRRSPTTHQALMEYADQQKKFYYYDTVAASGADLKDRTFRVDCPQDHRRMLANILKRSGYYIANKGHIDRPELLNGREFISGRYYEGAAAGAIMIGEAPRSEQFEKQFDWPDAVIHIPFHSSDIGDILTELNSDTERLRTARRSNAREAALRHDWLYRIQRVFDILGLEHTDLMRSRAQKLTEIASDTTP